MEEDRIIHPFQVVKDFEAAVARYTGAPYCVAVNSCTNALFLCLAWCRVVLEAETEPWEPIVLPSVVIPKRTYVSVPMQILHAGYEVAFESKDWEGLYQLKPLPIFDAARRFTSGMYSNYGGSMLCTSHHWNKPLGIQQGGCILHDNPEADEWFRRARFDGRTEGVAPADDAITEIGWHMYLSPEVAAEGLVRLHHLPQQVPDLPKDNYPDLSLLPLFLTHSV